MQRYRNDPYWITAKWAGKCAKCGAPIKRGERAFYYPQERRLYSGECAEQAASDFQALAADEESCGAI
jgi:hypothetical protein